MADLERGLLQTEQMAARINYDHRVAVNRRRWPIITILLIGAIIGLGLLFDKLNEKDGSSSEDISETDRVVQTIAFCIVCLLFLASLLNCLRWHCCAYDCC